jgi:hypothetical protein
METAININNATSKDFNKFSVDSLIQKIIDAHVITNTPIILDESSHYKYTPSFNLAPSSEPFFVPKYTKEINPDYTEKKAEAEIIEEWWKGEVTVINNGDKYFAAHLINSNDGKECIAEFNIDDVFENGVDLDFYLYPHATFAFYVVRKNGIVNSGLEFSGPYVWQEKDNNDVPKIISKYFPDDED